MSIEEFNNVQKCQSKNFIPHGKVNLSNFILSYEMSIGGGARIVKSRVGNHLLIEIEASGIGSIRLDTFTTFRKSTNYM